MSASLTTGENSTVGYEDAGLAVLKDEGDGGSVESDVDAVDSGASHGDAVMCLKHRGGVGGHEGDGVAEPYAPL